jgi:hypothetical protein
MKKLTESGVYAIANIYWRQINYIKLVVLRLRHPIGFDFATHETAGASTFAKIPSE